MERDGNILRPSEEGHWLTDGAAWATEVWLAPGADPSAWSETAEAPPELEALGPPPPGWGDSNQSQTI